MTSKVNSQAAWLRSRQVILLLVIYLAFVSLGLPDGVLGLAWPRMRASLGQPLEALGAVTFILAACSSLSGFVSGRVLARFGTGRVTFVSALTTGLSLLGLSQVPNFPLVVALAFPLGLGAGSVDAGLNHFVAEHYASKHMNWLHACWGLGATLGPAVMGSMLGEVGGWSRGYLIIAACQLVLASVLFASLGLWVHSPARRQADEKSQACGRQGAPRWAQHLSAALFALYVSVEMGVGMWAASVLIESRHIDPALTGLALTLYYGAITVGRVTVGFVSERLGNRRLVRYGLTAALVGVVLLSLHAGAGVAMIGLVLLGVGLAPVYPGLMHETPRRFDAATARKVIGWQVAAANAGAAIMPAAFGMLAAGLGLEAVFPSIALILLLLLFLAARLDGATAS